MVEKGRRRTGTNHAFSEVLKPRRGKMDPLLLRNDDGASGGDAASVRILRSAGNHHLAATIVNHRKSKSTASREPASYNYTRGLYPISFNNTIAQKLAGKVIS